MSLVDGLPELKLGSVHIVLCTDGGSRPECLSLCSYGAVSECVRLSEGRWSGTSACRASSECSDEVHCDRCRYSVDGSLRQSNDIGASLAKNSSSDMSG